MLKCHKANDLNSTYLWNRHLGHVRKERMKELHANGFLESFDFLNRLALANLF